ncbi:unnamed protein product [Mytilus coruscus]|uniref:Mab-21-like nucleotidyltransferase domain-containing protein n=1 Tax=Mytilus coruscus TaxID=42192 RepID=A0A6J8CA82_MYTCO|nr:unnamed protein product [Mytilus coruscus]
MSQTDRQLSLKTYQYLCNIIGTEEVVKTRRRIYCALDSVLRISNFTVISSGSKAEGLDLKGSDYDQMFVLKYFQVYENTSKMSSLTNKTPIIMDTSDTKPGFAKLKICNDDLSVSVVPVEEKDVLMIYDMSKTDRELSLKIFEYLCNIIGTEEVVKLRRKIFCALDCVPQIAETTVISSGSKAEGLEGQ